MPSPNSLYLLDTRRDGRWLIVRNDQRFGMRVRVPGATQERELPWMDAEWTPKLNADATLLMFTDGNQSAGRNDAVAMRKSDGSPPLHLGEGRQRHRSLAGRARRAGVHLHADRSDRRVSDGCWHSPKRRSGTTGERHAGARHWPAHVDAAFRTGRAAWYQGRNGFDHA
jgi:hypothetical protein